MATNADVLALVQRALEKDPTLSSRDLQERAASVDKSVEKLSTRQFHARYALQAKKQLAGPRKRKARKKRGAKSKPGVRRRKTTRGRATTRRRPATRGRTAKRGENDPVRSLLRERYEQSKAALTDALDEAFERSIDGDSLARMNGLLASVDRMAGELRDRKR